jgi:hypothetical protein
MVNPPKYPKLLKGGKDWDIALIWTTISEPLRVFSNTPIKYADNNSFLVIVRENMQIPDGPPGATLRGEQHIQVSEIKRVDYLTMNKIIH